MTLPTKPRILIFSIAYEPLIGGAELAVRNITDRLSSFEFDLITCRFDPRQMARERIGNVEVYRVGFGGRLGRYLYPVLAFRLARRLHRDRQYQVVWSIIAAYAGAAALMFLRRFPKVKFLLTLQEGDPIAHIHKQVRGFRRHWQRIFKRADYIQAISQYLADWAKTEGATCPVEVVPNGVDVEKFKIQNAKIEITNQNAKIIITTSRLVQKNGIDILIKAFAVIARNEETEQSHNQEIASSPRQGDAPRNDKEVRLLILGTGPEEKKLKKLSRDLKVDDRVEFLGDVSPDKISEQFTQADIFVRPSRSEGLGTAFLEAMAAGLPVVGTPVGGIPEIVTPPASPPLEGGDKGGMKPNGLLVKPEDPKDLAKKVIFLLQDEELRKTLGQNGRRLVEEKYNWDIVAKKITAIFAGLIAKEE